MLSSHSELPAAPRISGAVFKTLEWWVPLWCARFHLASQHPLFLQSCSEVTLTTQPLSHLTACCPARGGSCLLGLCSSSWARGVASPPPSALSRIRSTLLTRLCSTSSLLSFFLLTTVTMFLNCICLFSASPTRLSAS